MKLGCDLDGVVVDIVAVMLPHLSAVCGREVTERDISEYEFKTALKLDEAQTRRVWDLVSQEELYRIAPPIEGALPFLANLTAMDWRFVTSRPAWTRDVTLEWLATHGLPDSQVSFTVRGKPLVLDLNIDVFIEDDLETALALANRGVHVCLFDHPWNRNATLPDNCWRVHNWQEIDVTLQILKENNVTPTNTRL